MEAAQNSTMEVILMHLMQSPDVLCGDTSLRSVQHLWSQFCIECKQQNNHLKSTFLILFDSNN